MYCINKSGAAFGVYNGMTQVGTIYANECFIVTSITDIPGQSVDLYNLRFRGPNGTLMNGSFYTNNGAEVRSVLDYSFGGGTTNTGIYYSYTLKARAYLNIYDSTGNLIDFCYAGSKVLTGQNTTGDRYPHLLLIRAVERPAGSGIYYPVGGSTGYAFINTGLETCGSMSYNVGLYGNW